MDRLWVLGSAGWMPHAGQQTSCFLVEAQGQLVMLDAGTGVANLSLVADVLARYDHMSILLSHYHLDHIVGLMYLQQFVADKHIDVYGPGKPIYPRSTEEYIGEVLQDAVYSSGPFGFAEAVCYHDYGGEDFEVGDLIIAVRRQRHSSPSFELRVGDLVTYSTDTNFEASSWIDCAPTSLLLHECWQLNAGDNRHTSLEALVHGLPLGRFERKLLVHHNPSWDSEMREEIRRRAATHGIEIAQDGMVIPLR